MQKFIKIALLLFTAAIISQCKKDEQPPQVFKPFTIEKNEVNLTVGQTEVIKITSGNDDYQIVETDVSKTIASVSLTADKTGVSITAKAEGNTQISVIDSKVPNQRKNITIKVSKLPNDFALEKTEVQIEVGKTTEINITSGNGDYKVMQTESSKAIAGVTVSNTAQKITVTALAEGTATATVIDVKTNKEISISITVNKAPKPFTIEKNEVNLAIGQTEVIKITSGNDDYQIIETDASKTIASVSLTADKTGVSITAKAEGNTQISVIDNKVPDQLKIITIKVVDNTPKIFQFEKSEVNVKTGETVKVKILNGKGTYQLADDHRENATISISNNELSLTAKAFPAQLEVVITDTTLGKTATLTVYISKFSTADYQLSADGTTLLKWLNTTEKAVDMLNDLHLSKLTTIGENAFAGTQIEHVFLGEKVKSIKKGAFANTKISSLVLEETALTEIGEGAFKNSTQLTLVVLPSTLTTLGEGAFEGCTALTDITLPQNLTAIAPSVLANTAVSNLRLPAAVKTIGKAAFKGSKLRALSLQSATPPTLASKDAIPTTIEHIHVPEGSVEVYKAAANWSDYSNVID